VQGDPSGFTEGNPVLFPYIAGPLKFFNSGERLFAQYLDDLYYTNAGITVNITEQIAKGSLDLFPNPASENINLLSEKQELFEILSIDGKKMLNGLLQKGRNSIEINGLNNGIYILRTASGQYSKFIVE
jgi:hypothetical protein